MAHLVRQGPQARRKGHGQGRCMLISFGAVAIFEWRIAIELDCLLLRRASMPKNELSCLFCILNCPICQPKASAFCKLYH